MKIRHERDSIRTARPDGFHRALYRELLRRIEPCVRAAPAAIAIRRRVVSLMFFTLMTSDATLAGEVPVAESWCPSGTAVDRAFEGQGRWGMDSDACAYTRSSSDLSATEDDASLDLSIKVKATEDDMEAWRQSQQSGASCAALPPDAETLDRGFHRCDRMDRALLPYASLITAQEGRVMVSASLRSRHPVRNDLVAGAIRILQDALRTAGMPGVLDEMSDCPWLASEQLRTLVSGSGYGQQRLREETCMAESTEARLSVTTSDATDAEDMAGILEAQCSSVRVEELGEYAGLRTECEDMLGAFIAVHALVADKFVEFRLHRDNVGFKSEDAELLIRVARDSQRARGVQDGT